MQQKITLLSLLGLVLLNTGCGSYWKLTESETLRTRHYSLSAPREWMSYRQGSSILLSKHGPTLEHIIVLRHNLAAPLPLTSIALYTGMLPHELGELIVYRLIAAPGISNVILLDESVEKVDGRDAVKVTVQYTLNEATRVDVVYSFTEGTYLYELRYSAVLRHYYGEYLEVFRGVVKDFKLRK
ncbi:MAG: hypothetical protein GX640_04690 [Fibrobacter sp.]|nr:hypothetical protein [Fibrobacter sp.]